MEKRLHGQDRDPILPCRGAYLDMTHFTINVIGRLTISMLSILKFDLSFPLKPGTYNLPPIHLTSTISILTGLGGERSFVLPLNDTLAQWVLSEVFIMATGWVRDRGWIRVTGRVWGCFRGRVRMQL